MKRNTRVLIFAKAPVPGAVKTRLIPALGARGAAALQAALMGHTLATAAKSGLDCELWCHPGPEHPLFRDCVRDFGRAKSRAGTAPGNRRRPVDESTERNRRDLPCPALVLRTQVGDHLGERMAHAARRGLATGPVILIGTDCPSLTAADLGGVSMLLAQEGNDAVLGPALDGGYYLLGLRQSHPSLFTDMAWGSDRVLAETRRRLRALDWRWWELPLRRDMDRPSDLPFLPRKFGKMISTKDTRRKGS
ncbi:MAG: hypothetical protein BECKG1743D_GA0114223_106502 [Candidatus Kentron sp. G]|nr:MAG: hypothetical protein BECKG1743F_GA0114225_107302 [Candidatus Kentron sp. G]VFN03661.1 MAG: hypothetical protein BECKG1743E_GA0114224_106402 [Candidatus Kentron sp. G]VFN04938.1 MAG: hypothetical protein BECKG1743D_GA0114223_106502 [Candidatus Kentron sp. G]